MTLDPRTLLQILIFAIGIHVVLAFLRTTRGSGLVRGLGIVLIVLVGGLFGLAKQLQLAELEYILQGVVGFLVVILAIVFQPELRRGIVSLGENPLLRRLVKQERRDTVEEVAAAVVAMAKRKVGALVVFERDVPLDGIVREGVRVDSRVNRLLLESLFHSGGALHDGAVILRGDRIDSAATILPLSENEELGKTVGTRHRAALGLSEESDAVAVTVSEETGLISICAGGEIQRRVPRGEVEAALRTRLGESDAESSERRSLSERGRDFLRAVPQIVVAGALATGLFWLAWRDVQRAENFDCTLEAGVELARVPTPGELRFVLPDDLVSVELLGPGGAPIDRVEVEIDGSQSQLAQLAGGVGGVFVVPPDWIDRTVDLDPSDAEWGAGARLSGLGVTWSEPERVQLAVRRFERDEILLDADVIDLALLSVRDGLEVEPGSLAFDPPRVEIVGPPDAVRGFAADPPSLPFQSPDLTSAEPPGFNRRLRLREEDARGVRIVGDLSVQGRLVPRTRPHGTLELDVAIAFVPGATHPLERFEPPAERVTLRVQSRGILPPETETGREERTILNTQIMNFVQEHARVWIDMDRLKEGNLADLRVSALDAAWRNSRARVFDGARDDPDARLWLEIEGDHQLVLIPLESGDDDRDE